MKAHWLVLSVMMVLFLSFSSEGTPTVQAGLNSISRDGRSSLMNSPNQNYLQDQGTPLMFIENVGQFDDQVRFQVLGGNGTIWLTEDAIWMTLLKTFNDGINGQTISEPNTNDRYLENNSNHADKPRSGVNLKLSFNNNTPFRLEPINRLDIPINYYLGNNIEIWSEKTPVWGGVRCVDLYPGVDLEITGDDGQWNWQLVGEYGNQNIQIQIGGATDLELDARLMSIKTNVGELYLPLIGLDNRLVKFNSEFNLAPVVNTESEKIIISFPFNINQSQSFPDPKKRSALGNISSLLFSTYVGGSDIEGGTELALDKDHNILIAGLTYSSDLPTTVGAFDKTYNGSFDIIVFKLAANGDSLLFCTYLGGSSVDAQIGSIFDKSGNVLFAGYTESLNFPTTEGAFDRSFNGNADLFALKLSMANGSLLFSTYIGGENLDYDSEFLIDKEGRIIIVGQTFSSNFPTTTGAFDTEYNGSSDCFIVILSENGNSLLFSTYVGGNSNEEGISMALDDEDSIIVIGHTSSSNFPTSIGAYDSSFNGNSDVFCFKLESDGYDLSYSTFIGGSGSDVTNEDQSLVLDENGNLIVMGITSSNDFPTTVGAFDNSRNGSTDVFVFKLQNDGTSLLFSTYIGGNEHDTGEAIVVDQEGNTVIMGYTQSPDFPTTPNAFDRTHNDENDIFVLKLAPEAKYLLFSTYIGGCKNEESYVLALDENEDILVVGNTNSSDFPVTGGAFDDSYNGGDDVFIFKLSANGEHLRYNTFLGGSKGESCYQLVISESNQVIVAGYTYSSDFPVTSEAYDNSHNGGDDVFVSKLDLKSKPAVFKKYNTPGINAEVHFNDPITYTFAISYYNDFDIAFFDQIPTYTKFITDSLIAPAGLFYDPNSDSITGTLSVVADSLTTITFTVIVQVTGTVDYAPIITNNAYVYPAFEKVKYYDWSNRVLNFTKNWPVYFPLVIR